MSLAVISTHPIQYHVPVYRALEAKFGIPVSVIYGSDFSVKGYRDPEFNANFAWDSDLLSGYSSIFLSRVSEGGARNAGEVTSRGLRKELMRLTPKAVLILGYNPGFHTAAFYEARRADLPIIFRAETTDDAKKRSYFKNFIRDQILRFMYKRCVKLLYVGQNSYKHFKRLGCAEEKLIFSPYCVDKGLFNLDEVVHVKIRSEIRKDLDIPEDRFILLFSGKLSCRKGPDLILEAVKKLPAEMRTRILVLFLGDGRMKDQLERAAKNEPSVQAIFTGFKNQTQIGAYYHAADLLILPSRHSETWGLVVNEALHHGLPCIVSEAVGSAPDLIKPGITGEIFETNSPDSLASAMKRAVKLIGQSDSIEACRKAVDGYSVEKAAEGIARAYREVAKV